MTTTRVQIDGASGPLSVLTAGDPDAPPVLAVHGFGSSADLTWNVTGHLRALVAAGRRVVAPDLPGHGGSHKPHDPASYSLDGLVDDLRSVADQLAGPQVDLIGYSLGARLCVGLEAVRAEHGRGSGRLVLGGYDARPLFRGVDVAQLTEIIENPVSIAGADPQTGRIAGIVLAVPGNDRAALAALVAGLPAGDHPTAEPGVPTLVVAGTADPLANNAQQWAAGLPHGQFLPIPGRDHVSTVTAGTFRRNAAAFLAEPRPGEPQQVAGSG